MPPCLVRPIVTPPPSRASAPTLVSRIEQATTAKGNICFVTAGHPPEGVPWRQLHEEARAVAANLQALGVTPGDHIALLGPTSRQMVTCIQATWLAGAASVVLPLPLRLGSIEQFIHQTRVRVRSADAVMVIMDADLAPFIDPVPGDPPMVLLEQLAPAPGRALAEDFDAPAIDPQSLAILQFTSGSTANPKGVMLTHAQVVANIQGICQAARIDENDVGVSWLPLYHDMGLIGLLGVPMSVGIDLYLASPQDFLGAPARWVEWISEFGGTLTAGPNFAYALAARGMERQPTADLSGWRLGMNGAEPIDPAAVDAFCAAGARHRLDPRSVFCVYGMAEATLAVTFPEPGEGMQTDWVDGRALEHELWASPVGEGDGRGRRLALLGEPIGDLKVRIVDPGGDDVRGEREVGEIEVTGSSITAGYYRNPTATAGTFHDGWLRTGDLGYQTGGQLVVCGRHKDMIIVGGRNVFPEDIERAVATVPGVRQGNVIAFGVEGRKGREGVVVVAETREAEHHPIRKGVAAAVRQSVGLAIEDLVLVEAGSLPKTSSGKLQRSLCRRRYLEAELEPA